MKTLLVLLALSAPAFASNYNTATDALYIFAGSSPTAMAGNVLNPGTYDLAVFNGTPVNSTNTCSVQGGKGLIQTLIGPNSFRFPDALTATVHAANFWSVEGYLYIYVAGVNSISIGQTTTQGFSTDTNGTKNRWCGASACITGTNVMSLATCYHVAFVMSRTAGVFSRKIYFGIPPAADTMEASDTTNDTFGDGNFPLGRPPTTGVYWNGTLSDVGVRVYPNAASVPTSFPSTFATPTPTPTPGTSPPLSPYVSQQTGPLVSPKLFP